MTARKQRGEAEKRLRRNLERQGSPGPGGTIIQRSDEKDKKKNPFGVHPNGCHLIFLIDW